MLRGNHDSKFNFSLIISLVIVVLIVVGLIVFHLCSGEEDVVPSSSTTLVNVPDEPPWYAPTDSSVEDETGPDNPINGENIPTTSSTAQPKPDNPPVTEPTTSRPNRPVNPPPPDLPDNPEEPKLSCDRIASFSGIFVEDGSDVPAENVAALLVTNRSEKYLDLANVVYEIDGVKATFIITGLPAGKSTWVMEYTKMQIEAESEIKYVGCNTSFRDDAIATAKEVTLRCDGNLLYATNNTDRTLENVFIYYKSLHSDGNYFGGITYLVEFGSIEPGKTIEKLGGHFAVGESEIVRIGWQESQTEETT